MRIFHSGLHYEQEFLYVDLRIKYRNISPLSVSGKRTLKNTFLSDVDEKIQGYENKFKELQMAFQGHAVLQTGITVSRVLDNLDSLGELSR